MAIRPSVVALALLPAVMVATAPYPQPAAVQSQKRLNLISIVTDDQAQWSVGAYGNRESRTPINEVTKNLLDRPHLRPRLCARGCIIDRAEFERGPINYARQFGGH